MNGHSFASIDSFEQHRGQIAPGALHSPPKTLVPVPPPPPAAASTSSARSVSPSTKVGSPGDLRSTLTQSGEKRKRNPLACEPCRQRKAKCDGETPTCNQCKPRKLDCVYRTFQRKNQKTDAYIAELEARLRQLEGRTGDVPLNYDNRLDALSSAATMVGRNGSTTEYGWNEDGDEQAEENTHTADGMGVPGEGAASAFFGKSSISTMFKSIKPDPTAEPSLLSPTAVPPTPRALPATLAQQDAHGLPPRDLADALLYGYFYYCSALYPILEQRDYYERYARFWSDPGKADFLDLGILNLVFALGAHFLRERIPTADAVELAARFFKRARDILGARLMSVGSLRSVQALLLLGQFAQSSNQPNFCWNAVGMAVRVCQGLGLHVEAPEDENLSDVDRELRRRVYWTCFVMDRMSSTTYGRPTAIREDMTSAALPSPRGDMPIIAEADQSPGQPDLIHFFIATIKLYRIMSSILDALYAQTGNLVSEHIPLQRILELDAQVKTWEDGLPNFLRSDTPAEKIVWPSIYRQRNVLRLRALNVRLLLHRPCLLLIARDDSKPCADVFDLNLEPSVIRQSARICIEAARLSIESIHAAYGDIGSTSAPWYQLYYTFQSATCLVLLQKTPNTEVPFEARDESALDKAINVLSSLKEKTPTAAACYTSLTQLRMRAARSRRGSAAPEPAPFSTGPVGSTLAPTAVTTPIPGDVASLGLSSLFANDASASDWSFESFFSSSSLPVMPFSTATNHLLGLPPTPGQEFDSMAVLAGTGDWSTSWPALGL